MELKPTGRKAGLAPALDGLGNLVAPDEIKSPFSASAKGIAPRSPDPSGQKRRRYASEVLGATPPRDGPFAASAASVALAKPPKARVRGRTGGIARKRAT